MKSIDPEIKNYINITVASTVAKARHEFGLEVKGCMTELRDGFRQEIKMGFEAAEGRMREIARETTREVIREEVKPFALN